MQHAEAFVEGIRAQIAALPAYAGKSVKKHRLMPTQEQLGNAVFPLVNVTWSSDDAPARGGPRTGAPKFEHSTTLFVEVVDRDNDGPALRAKLSAHGDALMACLLNDLTWGGQILEGIGHVNHQVDLPPDGNSLVGRLQIRFDVLSSSTWGATATDDFRTLQPRTGSTPPFGISVAIPE